MLTLTPGTRAPDPVVSARYFGVDIIIVSCYPITERK